MRGIVITLGYLAATVLFFASLGVRIWGSDFISRALMISGGIVLCVASIYKMISGKKAGKNVCQAKKKGRKSRN